MEDSDPSVGATIGQAFAAQIASTLDAAALRADGLSNDPTGVLHQTGVDVNELGAGNGQAITDFDFMLDSAGAVRDGNFEPNGHVVASRTRTSLGKLKEATTNAYLAPPADLLPVTVTNSVPTNLTVGTSVDCSECYTADWNQLLVGMRTSLSIQPLRERFADDGQVAFLAWLRADVQLAHPGAFRVDTGLRG